MPINIVSTLMMKMCWFLKINLCNIFIINIIGHDYNRFTFKIVNIDLELKS